MSRGRVAALTLIALAVPCLHAKPAFAKVRPKPGFKKVLVVILENTNYEEAMKQPELEELASKGALLTNFHAETHPSQPNYVALISGDTHGVKGDGTVDLDARHLGNLLEAKHLTWKAYLEGYPGKCFAGDLPPYVRKHDPFISFADVRKDPSRCARLVPAETLEDDVKSGSLPDFALYIPDIRDDGHDTGVKFASNWLAKNLLPIIKKPLARDLLLIVTFDENGSWSAKNQIFTALVGAGVRPGSRSDALYNHYSILRTIEDRFGLGTLGANDEKAKAITGIWK